MKKIFNWIKLNSWDSRKLLRKKEFIPSDDYQQIYKSTSHSIMINGKQVEFPIRIKRLIFNSKFVVVALGFSASEDCGFKQKWTKEIDEKWTNLHKSRQDSNVYCYTLEGNLIWQLDDFGYYSIEFVNAISAQKIPGFKKLMNDFPNEEFLSANGFDNLIIKLETGEIFDRFHGK